MQSVYAVTLEMSIGNVILALYWGYNDVDNKQALHIVNSKHDRAFRKTGLTQVISLVIMLTEQ